MRTIRLLTTMLLLTSTIGAVFSVRPVQAGSTIHFGGLMWTLYQQGVGPIIHHSHVVIPDISSQGSNPVFAAGLLSVCYLTGDFDIQVSFKLSVWPAANGVRAVLYAGGVEVDRFSASSTDFVSPGEYYFSTGQAVVGTSDLSGGLRLTRSGTVFVGYYLSGATWVGIGGGAYGTTDDIRFYVDAGTSDSIFAHVDIKVAFRDFIITAGTLICPK
jgi:hypothetical protein